MSISLSEARDYTATAINLKYFDLNEADRVFTLFTREHGIVRAIAKGMRKSGSQFTGRMELLRCNRLLLHKGRTFHAITQCETAHFFPHLSQDYERLILALAIGEILAVFCQEQDPMPILFDHTLLALACLDQGLNPLLVFAWFEFHLLELVGYQLSLKECQACQELIALERPRWFDFMRGGLLCPACHKGWNSRTVSDAMLKTLWAIQSDSPTVLAAMEHDPQAVTQLQQLLQQYIQNVGEKKIRSLDLLNTEPLTIPGVKTA